jgi:hypothetical protein
MCILNRPTEVFLEGVGGFLVVAEQYRVHMTHQYLYYPCVDCGNMTSYRKIAVIQTHLITRGFMMGYNVGSVTVNNKAWRRLKMNMKTPKYTTLTLPIHSHNKMITKHRRLH